MVILAAFTTPKRVTRLIVATELAVDNTVFDLTGPRYEPQTYRSRDECVTASSLKIFTLYTTNYSVVTITTPATTSDITHCLWPTVTP